MDKYRFKVGRQVDCCYKCPERTATCHSKCKKYNDARLERQKQIEEKYKSTVNDGAISEILYKSKHF